MYDELGGDAAIDAALDAFDVKILADPQVNGYFDGVDMVRLKGHAKAFLTMAFGGPSHYMGRDLTSAHERPRSMGLNDDAVDVSSDIFARCSRSSEFPKRISPRRWRSPRAVEVLCSPADLYWKPGTKQSFGNAYTGT